jgi:hypothetical protein
MRDTRRTADAARSTSAGTGPAPTRWRRLATAAGISLFLGIGMALAYLGAFHHPAPDHLAVVVSPPGRAGAVAAALRAHGGGEFDVSTAPAVKARAEVRSGGAVAAYLIGQRNPVMVIDTSAFPTASQAAESLFRGLAAGAGDTAPAVQDLAPLPVRAEFGQNAFFLMVALTVDANVAALTISTGGRPCPSAAGPRRARRSQA